MSWFKTKRVEKPEDNTTHEVEAVQLTYVRWTSRHGSYSHHTRSEMEAFPSEKDANDFAESLRQAHRLLRNTSSEIRVEVTTK